LYLDYSDVILKTKMDQCKLKIFEEDGIDTSISIAMLKADCERRPYLIFIWPFSNFTDEISASRNLEGQTYF
jgi:hypothetical protein